ncbi:MAG: hypothetical protein LBK08_07840 [Treponema sp.]|jgi:hypothetical protein|nr:hypothetical protein [Treponema sp.]
MKKLIAISIVLVLLGPAVFAEVAVSAGVHGVFVPLEVENIKNQDDNVNAGSVIGWGGDRARYAQITFAGETEDGKAGFKTQLNVNENATVSLDDWAGAWVKPIDQIRLTVGRYQQDDIRGAIGANDGWAMAALAAKGEDNIFSRFTGDIGALLDIYPVPGLGVHFNISNLAGTAYAGSANVTPAFRVYERFQLAVSYELAGLGLIRAQYLNSDADGVNTRDANGRRIEAAFKFTAVEGLTLDVGVKVPFRYKLQDDFSVSMAPLNGMITIKDYRTAPWQASVGASGTFGSFGIWGRIDTYFLGNERVNIETPFGDYYWKENEPFIVAFALEPSYDLGFGTVGVYFAMEAASDYKAKTDVPLLLLNQFGQTGDHTFGGGAQAGFGAWFKIPVGSGAVKPGIAYRVRNNSDPWSFYGINNGYFSIPIEFDFSF